MKRSILMILSILFVASCAPATPIATTAVFLTPPFQTPSPALTRPPTRTPTSNVTPLSSLTPSMTSTPGPSLTTHKWSPKTVLVKLDHNGGDKHYVNSLPPKVVLYANGRLIVSRGFDRDGDWRTQLFTKVYSRQESCAVLNTIEKLGFLYYDSSTYYPQNNEFFEPEGASSASITINSWRSNFGEFHGLHNYSHGLARLDIPGAPIIPPALRETYLFLYEFYPESMAIYVPQKLGLIVKRLENVRVTPDSPVVDWPFLEISLAEIENITSSDFPSSKYFFVEGNLANSIYEYFGKSYSYIGEKVRQNNRIFVVYLRPTLPYEIPQIWTWNILPDPRITPPDFELECYPSDGIMPIPTSPSR